MLGSRHGRFPEKAQLNHAASEATRRSAARASEKPAPAAAPFTAATTGKGSSRILVIMGTYLRLTRAPTSCASASALTELPKACPEQNPRPEPVITKQRQLASPPTKSSPPRRPSASSSSIAFRWSGRLSTNSVTGPSLRERTALASVLISNLLRARARRWTIVRCPRTPWGIHCFQCFTMPPGWGDLGKW